MNLKEKIEELSDEVTEVRNKEILHIAKRFNELENELTHEQVAMEEHEQVMMHFDVAHSHILQARDLIEEEL